MPRIRVMTEPAAASPASFIPEWTLGDRLRKIRRAAGFDQTRFAAELGTNQKTYASWETDKSAPRDLVAVAKRIELVSGVPATWTLAIGTPPEGGARAGVGSESITARFLTASPGDDGAMAQVIALPVRPAAVAPGNALPSSSSGHSATPVPRSDRGRTEHHVAAA